MATFRGKDDLTAEDVDFEPEDESLLCMLNNNPRQFQRVMTLMKGEDHRKSSIRGLKGNVINLTNLTCPSDIIAEVTDDEEDSFKTDSISDGEMPIDNELDESVVRRTSVLDSDSESPKSDKELLNIPVKSGGESHMFNMLKRKMSGGGANNAPI